MMPKQALASYEFTTHMLLNDAIIQKVNCTVQPHGYKLPVNRRPACLATDNQQICVHGIGERRESRKTPRKWQPLCFALCLAIFVGSCSSVNGKVIAKATSENADAAGDSSNADGHNANVGPGTNAVGQKQDSANNVSILPGQPDFRVWPPAGAPKAVLLCLHEIGMHSGQFKDLGQRMADQGYMVYAMDERGFGQWDKVKTSDARMNLGKTLEDIHQAVIVLHQKHPGLPVFLLGEAMGGALALKAAANFPDLIKGTISSAPAGEHYGTTHNYMKVCEHLLTGPSKKFSYGKELIAQGTPRADLRTSMENDPGVRLNLSPTELMDCQFFMYQTKAFAKQIKSVPVMIVQGQQDHESKPTGAQRVYDNLATKDKQMLAVQEGDHYVFEDTHVNDKALQATVGWLDQHLATAAR
jgi:acylglycerol lipase